MNRTAVAKDSNSEKFSPHSTGVLQRKRACGNKTNGNEGGCSICSKGIDLDTQSEVPPSVINVLKSGGRSLESDTRSFMESRFGQDFSQVRVHTDGKAAESARNIGGLAYTLGQDIVFGSGQYSPATNSGKVLLAHELTHVLQQRGSQGTVQPKLRIGNPAGLAEQQADKTANSVVFGVGKVPINFELSALSIQRACGTADIGTPSGCNPSSPTFISGHPLFRFNKDCDDFAPTEEASLISTVTGLPSTTTIEIHGFASTDGDPTFNENLSCARAAKAHKVITKPLAAGGAGIAVSRIATPVSRHGPTPGPSSDRRSVVIKSSTPSPSPPVTPPVTPLTVAIAPVDASSSPAGMPDRIPPRVDTSVGVGVVGFSLPMRPITLSIDGAGGGNGDASINGAATFDVSSSRSVALRGITQTAIGNAGNLRLIASQGGTLLARSNTFSVSSIPEDLSVSFHSLVTGRSRGFRVDMSWDSDSGVFADLNNTEISERVEEDSRGGSLVGTGAIRTSGYLPGTVGQRDTHSVAALSASGFLLINQTFMFKDNRVGAVDIPLKNSGFRIGHFITPKPGTGVLGFFQDFKATSLKFGQRNRALGIASNAGSGNVKKVQNV